MHAGDFDVQLIVAEAQEEIIQRARDLRSRPGSQASDNELFPLNAEPPRGLRNVTSQALKPSADLRSDQESENQTSEDPGPLDRRTWRRATYLALVLLAAVCAAFFYLIQMARRINFSPPPTASSATPASAAPSRIPVVNTNTGEPAVSSAPTVRLYTDLIPGTVSVDDGEPQDLKDGELILDHLEPGRHSIKVAGRSGNAAFSFDVADKTAPQVVPPLTANNAMAVLISAQDGKGRVLTSLSQPDVSIDGKSAGQAGPDGLALDNLGNTDHELQVAQGNDHQRFVMTYTPAPVLTVYLKSDANTGIVTVNTQEDNVSVFVGDRLYRRKTDHGQIRLPLKVGSYTIRVHKDGFVDPAPQSVDVVKGQEAELAFDLARVPNLASLEVQGAAPGTTVFVDQSQVAVADAEGAATVKNVKEGEHTVELRLDGFTPRKFQRDFSGGSIVSLATPDTTLQKNTLESKGADQAAAKEAAAEAKAATPVAAADLPGEQVRRGGGFVHYNTPKATGHYSFTAHSKIGGFLKHDKLQWYAGYQNSENYIMFSLDGKHASLREMRDGKSYEVNRIPFVIASGEWVQVNMAVKPGSITASVKSPGAGWSEIGTASSTGRDFTQDKVGFYVPGNDEVAVANFHFGQ